MEPLNDGELDELLRSWQAPSAPSNLERAVRARVRRCWWKWFLAGRIRMPIPLTVAMAVAFLVLVVLETGHGREKDQTTQHADGFQPVKRLEVRIIRRQYEGGQ